MRILQHTNKRSKPLAFPLPLSTSHPLRIIFVTTALIVSVCPEESQLSPHCPSGRDGGRNHGVAPPARLANVSPVAQHPCYSIDTEVHFELQAGEKLLLMDNPSVLAIHEYDTWLHCLSHLEPQHCFTTVVSPHYSQHLRSLSSMRPWSWSLIS